MCEERSVLSIWCVCMLIIQKWHVFFASALGKICLQVREHLADRLANTKYKEVGMAALQSPSETFLRQASVPLLYRPWFPTSRVSSRLCYHRCLLFTPSLAMSFCTLSGHWICHCHLSLTFKAITHQQLGTSIIRVFEVKRILELDQAFISTLAFLIELHKVSTELEL